MSDKYYRNFWEQGFHVFGLHGIVNGQCDCDDPDCTAVGKHPLQSRWQSIPLWTAEQMSLWEQGGHFSSGYAVLVSRGLFVIDVDARNGGVDSYADLCADVPEVMSAGLVVETGSGGGSKHLYFLAPDGVSLKQHLSAYPGIDFKSSGFVVGPGSPHASGAYYKAVLGGPEDIDEAPAGLVSMLERPAVTRTSLNGQNVDFTYGQIRDMALAIPNDNDADYQTYLTIGMALHNATGGDETGEGVWHEWARRANIYRSDDVARRWHSFGKNQQESPIGIGSLYRMARKAGWKEPVEFDDGLEVPDDAEQTDDTPTLRTRHETNLDELLEDDWSALQRIVNMPWLVDDIIPADAITSLIGKSGTGKSFAALDIACCVASGRQWGGHDIDDPGQVVYLAAEAAGGLKKRKRVWEQHNHLSVPNMRVLSDPYMLDNADEVHYLVELVRRYQMHSGERTKLLVLDTLNRVMAGEENSATEMATFMRGVQQVQVELGCTVMIVHHSGHGDENRARGSSAFYAAIDSEMTLDAEGDQLVRISCTKAKDAAAFDDLTFTMDERELQGLTDHKGRPITSLVLTPATMMQEGQASDALTGREQAAMDIIDQMRDEDGAIADKGDVRERFYSDVKRCRDTFRRALSGLQKKGRIDDHDDDMIYIEMEVLD